jgi:uncharacterized Zn-binding protein involved in type VI secretion
MPGPIYHQGNVTICPHGGQVQDIPTTPRVLLTGMPAALMGDTYPIAGCAFQVAGAPFPCVMAQWITPALRVFVMGRPAMLQTSGGMTVGPTAAPQGAPAVLVNQPRVIAT